MEQGEAAQVSTVQYDAWTRAWLKSLARALPTTVKKERKQNKHTPSPHKLLNINIRCNRSTVKLVIRGQRGTGKTALLHRLEGKPIKDEYSATPEIQTGHIHWNFKNSHDLVKVHLYMHSVPPQCKKTRQACSVVCVCVCVSVCVCVRAQVEVWDVVDKAMAKPKESAPSSSVDDDTPAGKARTHAVPFSGCSCVFTMDGCTNRIAGEIKLARHTQAKGRPHFGYSMHRHSAAGSLHLTPRCLLLGHRVCA